MSGTLYAMLTTRQEQILNIIVREFTQGGTPVPSDGVAHVLPTPASPATVRNEMAELEAKGYIIRPYTSAGAVPSTKAYRLYVQSLAKDLEPPRELKEAIRVRFLRSQADIETWARVAAQLLAWLVHTLALATPPRAIESRWKRLELVYLQEFLALLIMVMEETRLKQQLVPVRQPVTQDELTFISNKLNACFGGMTRQEVASRSVELTPLEEAVSQAALDILKAEEQEEGLADPYVDGLRHMFRHPDVAGGSWAGEITEFLEDKSLMRSVLSQVPSGGDVQVAIGDENKADVLRPFSMVFAQYGVPGELSGVVGILGPVRMEYAAAISNVRYLSLVMSELVQGVHGRHA